MFRTIFKLLSSSNKDEDDELKEVIIVPRFENIEVLVK